MKPEFDIILFGHPKRDPVDYFGLGRTGGGGPSGPWQQAPGPGPLGPLNGPVVPGIKPED
ncbi:MAG: hypothetical protein Q8O83_01735 [bacterium]|nr:hypothetical protein [bacterium]